jgi:hypothetical protein
MAGANREGATQAACLAGTANIFLREGRLVQWIPGRLTKPLAADYSGFGVFAVVQSEPKFTRFGCKASIFSYRANTVQVTDAKSGFLDVARRAMGVKHAVSV